MDRLPLVQREAAFGFKVIAKSPLAVDPEALGFCVPAERARELAIAVPVLIIDGGEREAESESTGQAHEQKPAPGALGECDPRDVDKWLGEQGPFYIL